MSRARLQDIAAASPLIALYSLAIYGFVLELGRDVGGTSDAPRVWSAVVSHLASALFVALQIALFIVRKLPVAKLPGLTPRALAMAGANSGILYYILPRVDAGWVSAVIVSVGMIASVFVLLHLGRAFSILPQARALVTTGPYRFVRHPLYLAEQVASLGIMLQFAQPWSAIVFVAGVALQWPRMVFEERVLSETFPEYRTYASATARLIPGVY
jgi:protein-S-isoprenylcysteine O-methyltransferase Ste14